MKEKVLELVASAAGVEASTLSLETKFVDLAIDSLEFLQLLHDAEAEFGIKITDVQIVAMRKIGDLWLLVPAGDVAQ
jgi:acyl carrier protein